MIEQVTSDSGERIIEVMRDNDGSYILHKFIRKYDPEEETSYEIRAFPDPIGRYGDFDSAIKEAKYLLGIGSESG